MVVYRSSKLSYEVFLLSPWCFSDLVQPGLELLVLHFFNRNITLLYSLDDLACTVVFDVLYTYRIGSAASFEEIRFTGSPVSRAVECQGIEASTKSTVVHVAS